MNAIKILIGFLLMADINATAGSDLELAEILKSEVESKVLYPGISRQRGEEGTVLIKFKNGAASIHESSGHEALDQAALKASTGNKKIKLLKETVILPVTFQLVSRH